jgi:PAS domain S-box-containing protein
MQSDDPVPRERRQGERAARTGTRPGRREDAELRVSEARFRTLAHRVPAILWTASTTGELTFLNDRWFEYTGVHVRGVPGVTVHPDDREAAVASWMEAVRGDTTFEFEARRLRYDGEARWFVTRGVPVRDSAGLVVSWCGTATDIHELKSTQMALRASEERFRLATESLAAFLYDWDPRTNRLEWFGGLEEVLGFRLDQVEPDVNWWAGRIHPDDLETSDRMVRSALSGQVTGYSIVYRILHRNGSYISVADRSRIVRNEAGVAIRVLGGVSDITERRRLESEHTALLEMQARAAAEADARARDDVLGLVSHDLRNPLAAIQICASAVAQSIDSKSANIHRLLASIRQSAESMDRLIRDLLDVASIEAGHLGLELREEDPAAILVLAAEMFIDAASDQGIDLSVRVAHDLPAIRGDGDRILQALANLIGNALKFTRRGGQIALSVAEEPGSVRYLVVDTGHGIAAEDVPHVFARFWQKRQAAATRGTGLGLAIVRGIVEAHGGEVNLESSLGNGSRFSFTIPRNRSVH